MYNKLFTKILDSTIWLESDATRLVWITFLAAMDEDGFVALSSVGNVAGRARISVEAAKAALEALEGPDGADPSQEHEGRRVERVPYGWMVLNAKKYRDIIRRAEEKAQTRIRVAKHREKKRGNGSVTAGNEKVTLSVAVTEAVSETKEHAKGSPKARPASDDSPILEKLPLREGGEFEVRQSLISELEPLYPAVDIPATLKEMKGWLILNPDRRKTKSGIKRFMGKWLQGEQEKHG